MPTYVFEGDKMFEVDNDGNKALKGVFPQTSPARSTYGGQGHQYGQVSNWKPTRPWDGVDRGRFPTTWTWLVKFFFQPYYDKDTRWVTDYKQPVQPAQETIKEYSWEGYVGD